MNRFPNYPFIKILCCYLALFMAGLLPVPEKTLASYIYNKSEITNESDPESVVILQTTLENELIAEKLSGLGLSSEEITYRIEQLSSEERQIVLDGLQTIQAGGAHWIVSLLLFLILVGGLPSFLIHPFEKDQKHDLLVYKVTELDFPKYEGEITVLAGEEPEKDSFYILHLTARTRKLKKEKLLDWMREQAAHHGADTIILDRADPKINDSDPGVLYWTARAYITRDIDKER